MISVFFCFVFLLILSHTFGFCVDGQQYSSCSQLGQACINIKHLVVRMIIVLCGETQSTMIIKVFKGGVRSIRLKYIFIDKRTNSLTGFQCCYY